MNIYIYQNIFDPSDVSQLYPPYLATAGAIASAMSTKNKQLGCNSTAAQGPRVVTLSQRWQKGFKE